MAKQSIRILTNGPSDGASGLVEKLKELGVLAVKLRNDKPPTKNLVARPTVKWGCFSPESFVLEATAKSYKGARRLMNITASDLVLNKLTCLEKMTKEGVPCLTYTTDRAKVREWLQSGERVYVRASLRGSSGEGITVIEGANAELPVAPLYTKGVKGKRREYRIHVFNCNGVKRYWIQQKQRRQGFQENEKYDSTVRNLDHGWIFAHNEIVSPKEQTIGACVAACDAFGLHFGAVDVIEVDKGGQPYVLEINTAPGLEGSTVEFYANAIKDSLNG